MWVLLHGFAGAPEAWDAVLDAAPSLRAALRPTLVGHGPHPRVVPDTFEAVVDELAESIAANGATPVHLVGYSLGARLAIGLLVRRVALVRRATLIGPHPGLQDPAERARRQRDDGEWARCLREQGLDAFVDLWQAQPVLKPAVTTPSERINEQWRWRRAHEAESLARAIEVMSLGRMPDYWPRLDAIDAPVTVVVGADDDKFRRVADRMVPRLMRGRLAVAPHSGHNPLLDNPAWLARCLQRLEEEDR